MSRSKKQVAGSVCGLVVVRGSVESWAGLPGAILSLRWRWHRAKYVWDSDEYVEDAVSICTMLKRRMSLRLTTSGPFAPPHSSSCHSSLPVLDTVS